MTQTRSFAQRVDASLDRLSPAERRVAEHFLSSPEVVLMASAARLAESIGTSDATVVRTVKRLGYTGLAALRRELADELRTRLSPAARLVRTLDEAGNDLEAAFRMVIDTHLTSLERLRSDVTPELFRAAIVSLTRARRVAIFGIGPSTAMAAYFATQLNRFGIEAVLLTNTGLLFADDLHRVRKGDTLVMLAYTRIYREIDALLDRATELHLATILLTDSLAPRLGERVDLVLPVARGRTGMFSMHTATVGLIEALLVGIATERRSAVVAELSSLNRLRERAAGSRMDLQVSVADTHEGSKRTRPARTRSQRSSD